MVDVFSSCIKVATISSAPSTLLIRQPITSSPLSYPRASWPKTSCSRRMDALAYVANFSNGEVDVIDTTTYQVTSIPAGAGSRRLCISPAGDRVYVANYKGDSVSVIDTATKQLIATIPVGQRPRELPLRPTARRFTRPTS